MAFRSNTNITMSSTGLTACHIRPCCYRSTRALSPKVTFENISRRWYYDQWITTYKLLQHKICTVPWYSGLWNKEGLEFEPDLDDDDSGSCWHGRGFKDCNRD